MSYGELRLMYDVADIRLVYYLGENAKYYLNVENE